MRRAGQLVLTPFPYTDLSGAKLRPDDPDFAASGLKAPSVLRLSRLAVLDGSLLIGSIGNIDDGRLDNIRQRLARWIAEAG